MATAERIAVVDAGVAIGPHRRFGRASLGVAAVGASSLVESPLALPGIVPALALAAILGPSFENLLLA
jgi:hypothetical protein